MENIEQEIKTIMAEAMKKITNERIEHQKKCVTMLEQKMFDQNGEPEMAELFGIKPLAVGKKNVEQKIKDLDIKPNQELIDATKNDEQTEGVMGLMSLIECGKGSDIYEALHSVCIMTAILNSCDGLLIRVPCNATHQKTKEQLEGSITAMVMENTIAVVTRLPNNKTKTTAYDMENYTLGKHEQRLIDALFLAYILPKHIKKHDREFHDMTLAYTKWKADRGDATESDD